MLKMDGVTFAKRLHEARTKAGLTQLQVAEACGLTKGAVSAWEQGVTDGIIAENLFCVADVLRVDPRWLATGIESVTPASGAIAAEITKLPDEQQAAVAALIQSLTRQ